jgi:hypothetical protein
MLFRVIATSVLCLCLLAVPASQAFGQQNRPGQPGQPGQNGSRPVPEPSATLLAALALGGAVALKHLRRRVA